MPLMFAEPSVNDTETRNSLRLPLGHRTADVSGADARHGRAEMRPSRAGSPRPPGRSLVPRPTVLRRRVADQYSLCLWKQGDRLAPHKPPLVLFALGRWQAGRKDVTYRQAEPRLTQLLWESGSRQKEFS